MTRPRTLHDTQLYRTAREVFLEQGPGAPVKEIARRLEVSQAAVLQRAGTKTKLMLKALCPGTPPSLDVLFSPLAQDAQVIDVLAPLCHELLDFITRSVPGLILARGANLPLDELAPTDPPPHLALRQVLGQWLHQAGVRGSWGKAEALVSAMEARALNLYLGGDAFVDKDAKAFITDLLNDVDFNTAGSLP